MTSILKVSEIQDPTNGNTAMTIDTSGRVFQPAKPMMAVRGISSQAINSTGTFATFMEITGWTETHINIGNCLQNGRFRAPVAGIYHLSVFSQKGTSTDYRWCGMYHLSGGTTTNLINVYSKNDYDEYTLGGSLLRSLNANDEIFVGWDNAYSNWNTALSRSLFSCYLVA